ncbi:MAG: hypothetical protein GY870_18380 [archaeon]|nr:hypothetical protein [archaeon]
MVNVEIAPKQKDTCPKCGAMVNVQESQFCPDCGNDLSGTSIKIGNLQTTKYPDKCPSCKKKLNEKSEFCPFCGRILEKIVVSLPSGMKAMEVAPVMNEIDDFGTNEFSEYGSTDGNGDSKKDVRLIVPDSPQTAIFNGASILGSLQSFKALFITYEQYMKDPNSVNVDFSSIL